MAEASLNGKNAFFLYSVSTVSLKEGGLVSKSSKTVCYCHVTYEFQSESILYSLPERKGTPCSKQVPYLSLIDSNGIRTHNHLVRKRILNHLAKLAKCLRCVVSTYLYGAFDCMSLSCHVRVSE